MRTVEIKTTTVKSDHCTKSKGIKWRIAGDNFNKLSETKILRKVSLKNKIEGEYTVKN